MAFTLRSRLHNIAAASYDYEKMSNKKKEMGVESSDVVSWKNEFKLGRQVADVREERWNTKRSSSSSSYSHSPIHAQASICIPKALRWWDKSMKPNMVDIQSTQHLVDSLLDAGDKLVIVDFYSPGCGGCKSLHPKICQMAELFEDSLFLKVNYEEHKSMCQSLRIHVLPFFRFYRGDRGRICSFSCTNATIKKFKDALSKHGRERDQCSSGQAKGLEESELMSLASNRDTEFSYPQRYATSEDLALGRIGTAPAFLAEFEGKTAGSPFASMLS